MYTTLNKILQHKPCERGWNAISNYVGHDYDRDKAICFYTILDACGLLGAIWCLRTIDGHEEEKNDMLLFCSEQHTQEEMIAKFVTLFCKD